MQMKSYWSVMCASPHHGKFLKKLQRLAHFTALEVECERFILNDEKIEHSTFFVSHQASTWNELVLELLGTAKTIYPIWKMMIESQSLSRETSQNIDRLNVEYQMRLSGHRNITWSINETQKYTRMMWLNGLPNRW